MTGGDRVNAAVLRAAMERDTLDVLVALSPENFLYLSGALIITQRLDAWRPAAVVFPLDGARARPAAIVHSAEEALTRRESWIEDVRTFTGDYDTCLDAVADALCCHGLSRARIGIELDWLPV